MLLIDKYLYFQKPKNFTINKIFINLNIWNFNNIDTIYAKRYKNMEAILDLQEKVPMRN